MKRKGEEIAAAAQTCRQIVDHGYTSAPKECKDQIEALKRQLARLDERGRGREQELENVHQRLEHFAAELKRVLSEIDRANREEVNFM